MSASNQRHVAIAIDLDWPLVYHHELFAGTQRYARERGWACDVDTYLNPRLLSSRTGERYDGIIARTTDRLYQQARRSGVPIVNVWINSPVGNVASVFPDVARESVMAAEHLLSRGFRQFAFIGYRNERASRIKRDAFEAALKAEGCSCSTHVVPNRVSDTQEQWSRFQANLSHWVDSWRTPIGVSVARDLIARYLATVCHRQNRRVPEDIGIIGGTNEKLICLNPEPTLTSIDRNYNEIGYRAAALLERMISGKSPPEEPTLVEPAELYARQSTDVMAVADPVVAKAVRYIAEHSQEALSVDTIAGHVLLNRRTLERRFRAAVGRSIGEEIVRLRVERAKRQLADTDAPLKVIAGASGFGSSKRLCEVFRQTLGMTPGEYRRRRSP